MEIEKRIRELREAKGFTQSEMARSLGIALINYGKIERGVTELTISRISEIAKILSVRPVDFFTEYDSESSDLLFRIQQELKEHNKALLISLTKNSDYADVVESCIERFENWLYESHRLVLSDVNEMNAVEFDLEIDGYVSVLNQPNVRQIYFALLSLAAGTGYFRGNDKYVWKLAPFSEEEKRLLSKYFKWEFGISSDDINSEIDSDLVKLLVKNKLQSSKLDFGNPNI